MGIPSENRFNVGLGYSGKTFFGNANVNYASKALWIDVLNAAYAGFTDAYTMVNATLGVKFADGKVTVSLKGIEPHEREDPAAHLRRHPEAQRDGRAALLREVSPPGGARAPPGPAVVVSGPSAGLFALGPFSLPGRSGPFASRALFG